MATKSIKIILSGIILILIAIFMNELSLGGVFTGFLQLPIAIVGLCVSVYGFFYKE